MPHSVSLPLILGATLGSVILTLAAAVAVLAVRYRRRLRWYNSGGGGEGGGGGGKGAFGGKEGLESWSEKGQLPPMYPPTAWQLGGGGAVHSARKLVPVEEGMEGQHGEGGGGGGRDSDPSSAESGASAWCGGGGKETPSFLRRQAHIIANDAGIRFLGGGAGLGSGELGSAEIMLLPPLPPATSLPGPENMAPSSSSRQLQRNGSTRTSPGPSQRWQPPQLQASGLWHPASGSSSWSLRTASKGGFGFGAEVASRGGAAAAAAEAQLTLPMRTPSTSTPYQPAREHRDACEGEMAGLGDMALFNAYAQLAAAIMQVGAVTHKTALGVWQCAQP